MRESLEVKLAALVYAASRLLQPEATVLDYGDLKALLEDDEVTEFRMGWEELRLSRPRSYDS